ncbi:MAG TPA: hypothetical protein VFD82_22245 [Planctomycetota bacterium]|nr:hypothetical protein [Planctomycetota bacterium]
MRTPLTIGLAATALVAQSGSVIDPPQLAGVLEPAAASQFLLPLHGFTSAQLAYSPVPFPALVAGGSPLYVPDPMLCSANYAGADVAQLVCAAPEGVIVLLDATPSLALYVVAVPALTWSSPTGLCIDANQQQLVVLDAAVPSLLRANLADLRAGNAQFKTQLLPAAWSSVKGIAYDVARDRILGFDPATGELLQQSAFEPTIEAGSLRPLSAVLSFGFAPTASSNHDLFVTSGDETLLTDQWTWNLATTDADTATLLATVMTSEWVPPSPDPSGLTYDPLNDRLVVTDSEVDEMPIYAGKNTFEISRAGIVARSTTTLAYTPEPAGLTLDPAKREFYISDDDRDKIYVVATGADGLLNTADDSVRSFSVRNFCPDAEGLAFDGARGVLWIAGGAAHLLHKLQAGANGIFDGTPPNGDDVLTSFDVAPFGVTDPSGVALRSGDGGLYILGVPKTRLLHMNHLGQLVRVITLPATSMIRPQNIVFAPSTVGAGESLFLVDRGHDNDVEPTENDGKMREYGIPAPVQINQPPIVNSGPDAGALTTSAAHLAGTAIDDGLPGGPLTFEWHMVSGPGTASFTAPTQLATDVSFSAAGSYALELSAFDGELVSADPLVITVQQGNLPPVVDAGPSVTIPSTSSAHLAGTANDDGLPGPVTMQWSMLSGPGSATFTAPTQLETDVSFSAVGSYTLELSGFDGEFTSTDTVVVTVRPVFTVERAIISGNDDAEQKGTKVDLKNGTLEMVLNGGVNQLVGYRFASLTIPAGAVIMSANIQFTTETATTTGTQLFIAGQASDNALTFQGQANNISLRPVTAARVTWQPLSWTVVGQAGDNQRTPNLKNVVQEITNRPGWVSGNAMAFVVSGSGLRVASSYNKNRNRAAKLVVTYYAP